MSIGPSFSRCGKCGTPNPRAAYITTCLGCGTPVGRFDDAPKPETRVSEETRPPRSPRRLAAVVLIYGAGLVALCGLERLIGDDWWPGLLLILSPRWIGFIPLVPLGFLAVRRRRRLIVAMVAIEAALVAWPLMGFNIPTGRRHDPDDGTSIRIMTLNRGGVKIDTPRFARYVERHRIDVVCFQEFETDPTLDAYLRSEGWSRDPSGSIASRLPIAGDLPRSAERNADRRRYTMTLFRARIRDRGGREFLVGSLHLPTLRPGILAFVRGDLGGFRDMVEWWHGEFQRAIELATEVPSTPIVVAGDFNMPADSSALTDLRATGRFSSAFEEAGLGWGYTRPAALPWVRIDHILASPEWDILRCWVGPDFGSDHRSVVAEVSLRPARP